MERARSQPDAEQDADATAKLAGWEPEVTHDLDESEGPMEIDRYDVEGAREIVGGRRSTGDPTEALSRLATFLASEQASYITGQSIAVDGGWIRGLW